MEKAVSRVLIELSRMSTAVFLLVVVAAFSVCGTFLEQNLLLADYKNALGLFWFAVFDVMQLTHAFTSWWYLSALAALLFSVSCCLWKNGPVIWRRLWRRRIPHISVYQTWDITQAPADVALHRLQQNGFKIKAQRRNIHFLIKGTSAKLGYFAVHMGVVLLMVSGLVTAFIGYRHTVVLAEGMSETRQYTQHRSGELIPHTMPFALKNLSFDIDYYSTGMPKDFSTTLLVQGSDISQTQVTTRVNYPAKVAGLTIYQSSYGDAGSRVEALLRSVRPGVNLPAAKGLFVGKTVDITDDIQIHVVAVEERSVQENAQGEQQDYGAVLDYDVLTPDAAPFMLRSYLNYPDVIGLRDANGHIQNVYLGLALDDKQAFESVVDSLGKVEDLAFFTQKISPFLATLDKPERTEMALRMLQSAKILAQIDSPLLLQLVDYDKLYYSVLQVAYDPGFILFVIASVLLILGIVVMISYRFRQAVVVIEAHMATCYIK